MSRPSRRLSSPTAPGHSQSAAEGGIFAASLDAENGQRLFQADSGAIYARPGLPASCSIRDTWNSGTATAMMKPQ